MQSRRMRSGVGHAVEVRGLQSCAADGHRKRFLALGPLADCGRHHGNHGIKKLIGPVRHMANIQSTETLALSIKLAPDVLF